MWTLTLLRRDGSVDLHVYVATNLPLAIATAEAVEATDPTVVVSAVMLTGQLDALMS